jgi:hypothetical protein
MARYDLVQEFGADTDPDLLSVSPHWVLAVVRFFQPLTFSRALLLGGQNSISYDQDNGTIAKTKQIMVIDSDCVQLSVSTSKDSHVSSMNAVLMPGKNYLAEVFPTDWIMAWIVNSEAKAKDLKARIKRLDPCNLFDDGLKFIGRVQSVRKSLNIESGSGYKTMRYQVQALGGKEFDSSIFYDQQLGEEQSSLGQYLARFNIGISDIFNAASDASSRGKGGIDSNKVIPTLLKLMLGDGIPPRAASPGGLQIAEGLTSVDEAQYAYAVPVEIGKLLGRDAPSKQSGVLSYADLFELLIGLQKYSFSAGNGLNVFIPDGLSQPGLIPDDIRADDVPGGSRRVTPFPLKGEFQPRPVPLVNTPVWSLLDQFLNPAVNEMYYTLRVNPEGKVVPTLVVRQLPFSTPMAVDVMGSDVTGFLELPRWVVHPILVESFDVGRSDATHFNFIHIYGQASAEMSGLGITEQIIRNPPIRDEQDIKRNGIHPYMETVSCSIDDTVNGPKVWMSIVSDFLMGQQLTLNGSIAMRGIQSPICPGDNIEFDGTVYHIESVAHLCSIGPTGNKSFTTALALTHGIRSDIDDGAQKRVPPSHTESVPEAAPTFDFNQQTTTDVSSPTPAAPTTRQVVADGINPDLFIYSGVVAADNSAYDPGLTVEDDNG